MQSLSRTHAHTHISKHALIKHSSERVWGNEQESKMNYGSYSDGRLTPLISGMLM